MKERICKNCKWFDASGYEGDEDGFCRKSLPTVIDGPFGTWPIVAEIDWCGEYSETWTPGEFKNDK